MLFARHFLAGLMCVCISSFAAAQDEPSLTSGSSQDLNVVVQITNNAELKGAVTGLNQLKLTTKFGPVTIPLGEIEGAKLHSDEKDACVVAFKNGDIITGQLALERVSIATAWGDANIRIENIETLLINAKGSFFKDSANGKTVWRFSETRPVASPQRRTSQATPSARTTRPNTVFGTRPPTQPRGPGRQ